MKNDQDSVEHIFQAPKIKTTSCDTVQYYVG